MLSILRGEPGRSGHGHLAQPVQRRRDEPV